MRTFTGRGKAGLGRGSAAILFALAGFFVVLAPTAMAFDSDAFYNGDTTVYNFTDITGTGQPLTAADFVGGHDDGYATVTLPFNFTFYGLAYNQIFVGTNGIISFGPGGMTGSSSRNPQTLPDAADPNAAIAAYWEDLDPSAGGTIHHQQQGTFPNRFYVVQYKSVPHYISPPDPTNFPVSFQVKLFETGLIEIHYQSATSDGDVHTIGIESHTGTQSVEYINRFNPTPLTSQAIRFTPTSLPPPSLSVSPDTQNVASAAGTATVTVTTTGSWSAVSSQGWATLSPASGTGPGTITATYTENTNAGARTAMITVTGTGTEPPSVMSTLVQEGAAPTLSVSPTTQSLAPTPGTTLLTVNTTAAWTATSDQPWATLSPLSATGNATITVTYAENTTASARTATVTITGTGTSPATVTASLNQERATPTLSVKPDTQDVPADSGTTTVDIETTEAWTIASNQSWCTVSPSSGTGNQSVTVTFAANPDMTARTATLTVTGTGTSPGTDTAEIVQAGASVMLGVTPTSQTVEATGDSVTFNVATTAAWTAASNATWASVSPAAGTGNGTITVMCSANASASSRSATVTVMGTATSPESVTVTVSQEGCDTPSAPQNVTASRNQTNGINVSWSSVSGATSYRVYRALGSSASFSSTTLIQTTTGNQYLDTSVQGGNDEVIAVNGCGNFALALGCNAESTGCLDVQRVPGPDYTYYVVAASDCGESAPSGAAVGAALKVVIQEAAGLGGDQVVLLGLIAALWALSRRLTRKARHA